MAGVREDWLPTSVWYFDNPGNANVNQQWLQLIQAEQEQDREGMRDRSSVLGWHSIDNLHQRQAFQPFIELVQANVQQVAQFNRWDLQQCRLVLLNCWAIVNGKYAYNTVHNHPNSILSGVYYIQAPENCGKLFFRDPRDAALMMTPPIETYTPWTHQRVLYEAIVGRMILFPSWLWHGVEPNLGDRDRICLSFNIGMQTTSS